jgi:transcriptional regulator with XRE-family HTH domain
MDMQIDKQRLRQLRESRAWTQSQLAEVSDLGLRTVQRIENTGMASKESAMALASALEVSLAQLYVESPTSHQRESPSPKLWGSGLGFLLALLISLGWWSSATAEQVMMNLTITTSLGDVSDMKLLSAQGQESWVQLDSQLRLLLTSHRQDEHLLLSIRVYDYVGDDYILIASPSLLIADQQPTKIELDTRSSGRIEMRFEADF